jgi:hypothetical protein
MDYNLAVNKYSEQRCVAGQNTDITFDGAG